MFNDDLGLLTDPYAPHPVVNRHICSGGGGGQQQQPQQSYQQTKASNEPPAFIQPFLQSGIQDLTNLYHDNPTAPGYYPGSTVAPQSAATKGAIDMLAARGYYGSPTTQGANVALTDTLNGKYLDPTTNPAFLKALSASHQPAMDQFLNQTIPGITSAFEGSGRTASGAHQGMVDQATTSFNRAIADADAKAGADYFNSERNRMITSAATAPQVAAQDYNDINALGNAGEMTDTYNQAKTNEDISRYNYDNNKQWDYIARYLALVNGGYPGGQTNSTSYGQSYMPQTGGGFGSYFGPAMSLAGLGLSAYSAFSDERLKEDISAPIGSTFDGIPIRLWRYKGDPEPRVGVIAQEVERVKPEAVDEHPSGFKTVNYAKAMRLF